MALPTPDMDDCCKKQKCVGGPNHGAVYSTCDPCQGLGTFDESKCDCITGAGVFTYQIYHDGSSIRTREPYFRKWALEMPEPWIDENGVPTRRGIGVTLRTDCKLDDFYNNLKCQVFGSYDGEVCDSFIASSVCNPEPNASVYPYFEGEFIKGYDDHACTSDISRGEQRYDPPRLCIWEQKGEDPPRVAFNGLLTGSTPIRFACNDSDGVWLNRPVTEYSLEFLGPGRICDYYSWVTDCDDTRVRIYDMDMEPDLPGPES